MATHYSQGMLAVFFGLPGWAEMILIAFVGLLLFGKRLPDVARSLGTSIVEFKKGMREVKDDMDTTGDNRDRRLDETRTAPLPHATNPPPAPKEEPAKPAADAEPSVDTGR